MTYNLNNNMAHRYNTSLRLYCFCRRTIFTLALLMTDISGTKAADYVPKVTSDECFAKVSWENPEHLSFC